MLFYPRIIIFIILLYSISHSKEGFTQKQLNNQPVIEYSYKQYTLHDGLIQMQVTALFQDELGFIWCGTKGGISRFDGKTFINYSKAEAKLSGLVIKFGKDSKNNLLIFHPSGITKFDGNKFHNYQFDDGWYLPDQNSNYLSGNYFLLYKKSGPNQSSCRIAMFQDSTIIINYDIELPEGSNQMIAVSDFTDKNLAWIMLNNKANLTNLITDEVHNTVAGDFVNIVFQLNKNLYSLQRNGIHLIQNDTSYHITQLYNTGSFPKPILSMDCQSVFIKNQNGIYQFMNDSLYIIHDHLNYVRDILLDYEGNLWVATEEGLLNFFKLDFRNYQFSSSSPDYVWTIIEDSKNNMWFGSFTNGLWMWDGKNITDYDEFAPNNFRGKRHFYMGASRFEENVYFPTIQQVIKYDGIQFSTVEGTSGSAFLYTLTLDDGTLLCTGHNGLYEFRPQKDTKHWSVDELNIGNVTTVNTDKYGRYIAGGYGGIAIVDGDGVQNINNPKLKNILCIEKDHLQNLWFGGINESLFLYVSDTIKQVLNFEDNAIHSMIFDEPRSLLLGCRNGLFIFDILNYYKNGDTTLIEYNQNNGFIGLECGQNAFFQDSKKDVWIATSNLVTKFNPKHINRQPAIPNIYIESLLASKDKIDWITLSSLQDQSLEHNFNSLKIKFTSVCFSATGNINYFYSLKGIQDEWSAPQKNDEIVFYNLKPGKYTFYLKANNGASDIETEVITASFTIKPALWQQAWFIILSLLLFIFVVFSFIRLFISQRLKKKEKELALEKIRTGLQVRALDNKSNHHFIFNILNNIGFNIIQNETEEAYNLFSKLSWFFRLSLKSPDNITTSLSHQLETVNDYLFLQKNRLGDRLSYNIEFENPELKNNELPRNILQTIVDNAVTHGIEPKDDGGNVKINVTSENEFLVVTVIDNGIGRQKSKNLNTHKKHGLGLNIYKQFFELFNKTNTKKASLVIADLINNSNKATGTSVKILMPLNYNFIS